MSGYVVGCAPGEGRTQRRRRGGDLVWVSGHWLRSMWLEIGGGIVYIVLVVLRRGKAQEGIARMVKIWVSKNSIFS